MPTHEHVGILFVFALSLLLRLLAIVFVVVVHKNSRPEVVLLWLHLHPLTSGRHALISRFHTFSILSSLALVFVSIVRSSP